MRLWARLALILATVAVLSVAVVGGLSSSIAGNQAVTDSQDRLRREARLHAEVIGRWVADQMAHGDALSQLFPGRVETWDDRRRHLLVGAGYRGTPAAVISVMVDADGQLVVPAVHRSVGEPGERPVADPLRVQELLERLPVSETLASGTAVGEPWRPDTASSVPSVPMGVLVASGQSPDDALILGFELQLSGAGDLPEQIEPAHGVALIGPDGTPFVGGDHPLLDGPLVNEVRQALVPPPEARVFDALLPRLSADAGIERRGPRLARPEHRGEPDADAAAALDRLVERLEEGGVHPPHLEDAAEGLALPPDAVGWLVARGRLLRVRDDFFVGAQSFAELVSGVAAFMASGAPMTPVDFKEISGLTRRHAMPFLEYLDREKVTVRRANERSLGPGAARWLDGDAT